VLGGTGTELRRSPPAAAGSLTRVVSRAALGTGERSEGERGGETGGDELRGGKGVGILGKKERGNYFGLTWPAWDPRGGV
jgi:hypothetical protein